MFDFHVLDMVEFGIDSFKAMLDFPKAGGGCTAESKPCLLFTGAEWEHTPELQSLRSLLIDFFHLQVVEAISPLGVEHVICFTVAGSKVYLRHYLCKLLKSAEGTGPHVVLEEMGPSMDLVVRRTHWAQADVMKAAMVRPKAGAQAPKKVKNVTRSKLLGKQGRLHMPRQDLTQLATARMKGLRKARPEGAADGGGGGGDGDGAAPPTKRPRREA